ncbi:MAG: acyltransferase [Acidimicrobiia bacterium]|nr:acyltransferase [Acidimicrobiia bacterium]
MSNVDSAKAVDTNSASFRKPRRHRADVQGLRACAVLLVIAYHAGLPIPGGFTGVDVFFVISGFVITSMLRSDSAETGRISLAQFYARRVRRILPALALMTTVVAALSFFFISPLGPKLTTAKTGIAASLFSANIFLYREPSGYFAAGPTTNPLLQTWSLSVEEQFYLVFPALLILGIWLGKRFLRPAHRDLVLVILLSVVTFASFVLCLRGSAPGKSIGGIDQQFAFYMAPARAWEFSTGALIALCVIWLARLPKSWAFVMGCVGALLVAIGAFTIHQTDAFPGYLALWPVVGTSLLLIAGVPGAYGMNSVLGTRPFTYIGDMSYSWYLWHWPLIVFAIALWPAIGWVALPAAAISFLPAWTAYKYFENPIRSDHGIVGRRALKVGAICILIPIVACVGLAKSRLPNVSGATRARLDALSQQHPDELRNCDNGKTIGLQGPRCIWRVDNPLGTVALVGDSNAGHFIVPAAAAANKLGYNFEVATRRGCRFVDVVVIRNGRADQGCTAHVERSLDELVRRNPNLVLIASSSPQIVNAPLVSLKDPETGRIGRTRAEKAALWKEGNERAMRRLARAGIPTLLIQTIPQFPDWPPNCAAIRAYFWPSSCGTSSSREQVDAFRSAALNAERDAVDSMDENETFASSEVLDFADRLCAGSRCATNRGDFWIYRDETHLSVPGARTLTPELEAVMRSIIRRDLEP